MSYKYENESECPCCEERFSGGSDEDDDLERIAEHVAEEHRDWVIGVERSHKIFERARAIICHQALKAKRRTGGSG